MANSQRKLPKKMIASMVEASVYASIPAAVAAHVSMVTGKPAHGFIRGDYDEVADDTVSLTRDPAEVPMRTTTTDGEKIEPTPDTEAPQELTAEQWATRRRVGLNLRLENLKRRKATPGHVRFRIRSMLLATVIPEPMIQANVDTTLTDLQTRFKRLSTVVKQPFIPVSVGVALDDIEARLREHEKQTAKAEVPPQFKVPQRIAHAVAEEFMLRVIIAKRAKLNNPSAPDYVPSAADLDEVQAQRERDRDATDPEQMDVMFGPTQWRLLVGAGRTYADLCKAAFG